MVLILAALVIGVASVFGAPILAIPIILLLPGPIITFELLRRQYRQRQVARFRRSATPTRAYFDAKDQETISR